MYIYIYNNNNNNNNNNDIIIIIYIYIHTYIYIIYIYIYIVYLGLWGYILLDWFGNTMAQWWEHRRLRASRSAVVLRLCGLHPCAWYDTILSQNMLLLFVSPETCWTDFAGMQTQGFSRNMADLPDLCWFTGGLVCFYLNTSSPQACYLLVSGLPPQSLSPMLLKDATGPQLAAYVA